MPAVEVDGVSVRPGDILRNLENQPGHGFDYTSITFLEKEAEALLTYHDTVWFSKEITVWGRDLKLRIVAVDWFYDT